MYKTVFLFCLLNLFVFQVRADIFGRDDRENVSSNHRKTYLARSVAVGVINSLWEDVDSLLSGLMVDPLSDFMCSDERFVNQHSVSYACTGFLVGPDLLVTAGHCSVNSGEIRNSSEKYCEAYTWLFGYDNHTNIERVPKRNIYNCKEIIYATQMEVEGESHDFSLIRLDRTVKDRTPLKLAHNPVIADDAVSMIGHPMGLPLKYTDNARVIDAKVGRSFYTDLDAFSGNSGSPVFNKRDEVVGLLVAGNPAQAVYTDPELGCERYNRCDENGQNCDVLLIDGDEDRGFPYTYSEVQDIDYYRDLIQENL